MPMTMSLGIMIVSMGCEDEVSVNCDGDRAQPVEQFYEDEYDVANCQFKNLEIKAGENNFVIKNQNDYEKFVTCNDDLPNIDFDKYFILAGVYQHHQCATLVNQQILNCNGKINFNVKIEETDCLVITEVTYLVVLERKYEKIPISYNIKIIINKS